jgi:signal transduction histidine kinase
LDAAQKASATKSEFLSRMSHEMRTPISAILGLTQLGIEETHDRESRDAFRKIHESCTYLLGLINDVLDMSHIEAAKVELHPQLLTMSQFLESLDALIQPQCRKGCVVPTRWCERQRPLRKSMWMTCASSRFSSTCLAMR